MTAKSSPRSARHTLRTLCVGSILSLVCVATVARAQDAVRPSLAGEAASEARRQSIDRIPYNLMLGPVKFRFSATAGFEYNDNINLASDETATFQTANGPFTIRSESQSDFIFRPQINVDALWPVTQLNTLRFDLGMSYAFYLDHSNYNTNGVLIAPGSQLAFDVFVGDFRINFHDRFSLEQDPVAEIALSNVADYGRFQNTAGVSALWDLNRAVVTLGYDHYTFISTTDAFSYLDRNAEELSATINFTLTNTTGIGLETAYVHSYYDENILNNSDTYSVGAFMETQITNYLKLRIAGGYQAIAFDNTGQVNDPNDANDFYANALLSHRVNAQITQTLSAGHETQLGVNSNYVRLNYVRHTATWNILLHTLLSTELFYEDADDSGGFGRFSGVGGNVLTNPFVAEHIHRYGGALTVGYQLTKHVTLGLRYQYTKKDSDQPLRDYEQNRVSLDGTYSF
ncbi:MAG: outer membrane beta-barrel protein [Verrucomicrobiota bacterium]|nr:outer membrane beta-barrel protein [Verrucomicrobiota bacterium]